MEGMLPYVPGWEINHDLAAKAVSACWAGCESCQQALTPTVVADRATLAGLAGAVFLTSWHETVQRSPFAGPAARAWIERTRGAAFTSRAEAALRAVSEMSEEDAEDLLQASLDLWVVSGAAQAAVGIGLPDGSLTEAPPRQRPADPMDAFRRPGSRSSPSTTLTSPRALTPTTLRRTTGSSLGRPGRPKVDRCR